MKSYIIILLLIIISISGEALMAQEFSVKGVNSSTDVSGFRFDLSGVTLEESNQGAAINLSMQLTDANGATEKVYLTVPATHRTGKIQSRFGTISLKNIEGLDSNFHKTPEKIIWLFEFIPELSQNKKSHIYMVNGKQVTEQAYQELSKTLTGQERWYCAELLDGGETGWISKDAAGNRYKVVNKSGTTTLSSISKLPEQAR
jgi:hypothetical protein